LIITAAAHNQRGKRNKGTQIKHFAKIERIAWDFVKKQGPIGSRNHANRHASLEGIKSKPLRQVEAASARSRGPVCQARRKDLMRLKEV